MTAANTSCKIIPFPDVGGWSRIAKNYVDYMTSGDPRAAFYYLEHELNSSGVSATPGGLKRAIEREYRKRGFLRPIGFH